MANSNDDDRSRSLVSPIDTPLMMDRSEDSGATAPDVADRKMLAEIKANVLGTAREDLRIGRFRVLEPMGEGSMGTVHAAFDDQLQRRVAIKLLHPQVGASERERRARLLREAQILAQLQHPNIVQVYEAGEHDGQLFMAMELVEGQPLAKLQKTRAASGWREILAFYVEAGRGLAAAHAKGVVHRDFKPDNVLVDASGRVRVVDFGLAREGLADDEQRTAEMVPVDEGAIERPQRDHLTATGDVPGTPAYMAPELFDGQPASAASDQFSFCVSLYEALYGRRPFEGKRFTELVKAAKQGRISPPPADRPAPKWLFEVLSRGLAAKPEARFPSMTALLEELERDRLRWWKRGGAALGVAAGVLGGTFLGVTLNDATEETDPVQVITKRLEAATKCRDRVLGLKSAWHEAKAQIPWPSGEQGDVDGLAVLLDVDAARLLELWEGDCLQASLERAADSTAPCRERAEIAFLGVTDSRLVPQPKAFHDLAQRLALCLEGGASISCTDSSVDPGAADALAKAESAELTGRIDESIGFLDEAIAIARAAEPKDRLTLAQASFRKGVILESRGDVDGARWSFVDAALHAMQCNDDVLAFDAEIEAAKVEYRNDGRIELAKRALDRTEGLIDEQRMPLRHSLLLEKRGGVALYLEEDCERALSYFDEALEIREAAIAERRDQGLPTELLERQAANAELNIANAGFFALARSSDRCKAKGMSKAAVLARHQSARGRLIAALGDPRHPEVADFDFDLGVALLEMGDIQGSIEALERVASIQSGYHGLQEPIVADAYRVLASAYSEAGDFANARKNAEANLDIRKRDPRQILDLAQAYDTLGVIQHNQLELEAARNSLVGAVGTLYSPPLSKLPFNVLDQLYWSQVNLAMVELDRNDREALRQARDRFQEIQGALAAQTGLPYPSSAHQRIVEAEVLLDDGKPQEALQRLDGIADLNGYDALPPDRIDSIRERAASMN